MNKKARIFSLLFYYITIREQVFTNAKFNIIIKIAIEKIEFMGVKVSG